jgi:hypothetical protein
MRIVFGVKHFKLKSYSLKELGLSEEEDNIIKIELRQKYFHLYWIPFFPTGKTWVVRKDNQLYDLPLKYKLALAKKEIKHRTPFYTFALPLLLILGFTIYLIGEKIDRYASKKRAQERFKLELVDLNKKITNPTTNDFYELKGIKKYLADTYVKVHAISSDSVQLHFPETKPSWYSSLGSGKLAAYFSDTPDNSNLVWVSIDELKKCIQNNYGNYSFKGNYLPFTEDSINYRLVKIFRFKGPEFIDRGEGNMSNNIITITLMNKGLSTTITEINSIESNVEWNIELPKTVFANKKFAIVGSYEAVPSYDIEIICTDNDGSTYKYELKGKGISRNLRQL